LKYTDGIGAHRVMHAQNKEAVSSRLLLSDREQVLITN
jgi:hypothetical protein